MRCHHMVDAKRPSSRPRAARRKFHGVRTPQERAIIPGPFGGLGLRRKLKSEKQRYPGAPFPFLKAFQQSPRKSGSSSRTSTSGDVRIQGVCILPMVAIEGGCWCVRVQWPPAGSPVWLPLWPSLAVYAQSSDGNRSARSKPLVLSVQSSTDTVSVFNTLGRLSPESTRNRL